MGRSNLPAAPRLLQRHARRSPRRVTARAHRALVRQPGAGARETETRAAGLRCAVPFASLLRAVSVCVLVLRRVYLPAAVTEPRRCAPPLKFAAEIRLPRPHATPQVWRDALSTKASAPYLNHQCCGGGSRVQSLRFCPYDDVLAVGHAKGISSLLVRLVSFPVDDCGIFFQECTGLAARRDESPPPPGNTTREGINQAVQWCNSENKQRGRDTGRRRERHRRFARPHRPRTKHTAQPLSNLRSTPPFERPCSNSNTPAGPRRRRAQLRLVCGQPL